jgi:hypothetical protein
MMIAVAREAYEIYIANAFGSFNIKEFLSSYSIIER